MEFRCITLLTILTTGSLYLTAQQNVGIGTTDPSARLDIVSVFAPTTSLEESFENGTLGSLTTSGDALWSAEQSPVLEGTYSARSGIINASQSSIITITGTIPANRTAVLSFHVTWALGDHGILSLAGDEYTGDKNWILINIPLTPGAFDYTITVFGDGSNNDAGYAAIDLVSVTYDDGHPLRIADGREGPGKFLVSDEYGNAGWIDVEKPNQVEDNDGDTYVRANDNNTIKLFANGQEVLDLQQNSMTSEVDILQLGRIRDSLGSVSIGNGNATGPEAMAWGSNTTYAEGLRSTAFGMATLASGTYATSWGEATKATDLNATAWGSASEALAWASTAWGQQSTASGFFATAWGRFSIASAQSSTAFGQLSDATGNYSTAFGYNTLADTTGATTWGNTSYASGLYSTAFGLSTDATGDYSTAFGENSSAQGLRSTAWGIQSSASNTGSTAWGTGTSASGLYSTSWGDQNDASGQNSTAWGFNTTASGIRSTTWGQNTIADAYLSTAWGNSNRAQGEGSTAFGRANQARSYYSTALGTYNVIYTSQNATAWEDDDPIFVVGNGQDLFNRRDGIILLKNGNFGVGKYPDTYFHMYKETSADARFEAETGDVDLILDGESGNSALEFHENGAFQASIGWSAENDRIFFYQNSTNAMFLSNGNVGIKNPTPTYDLDMPNSSTNGTARAFQWLTYSDRRVKDNIAPLKHGLREVLSLRPVQYDQHEAAFNNGVLELSQEHDNTIGLIAQEVHDIIPEAVSVPEDENVDLWGMDYEKLVPVLVKAIQDQQEVIEEQSDRLDRLEALVGRLKQANADD